MSVPASNLSADTARLGRVGRIDEHRFDSSVLRLVDNEVLQLSERPTMEPSLDALACLDICEVSRHKCFLAAPLLGLRRCAMLEKRVLPDSRNNMAVISKAAIACRKYWIGEIKKLSGNFGTDSDRVESELASEIASGGVNSLLDHLRLCGDIPESYGHDSSEEKLYSKYTDAILAESFRALGLTAVVLKERADAADVEAFGKGFSLVGDAKTFRLSRTAKNAKDFKIQAMDGWKRGKPYAVVVCPINQMPTRASQIYQQACARNVAILSYSHFAVLAS